VNGPAAAGGFSLSLAADIRLAGESARFQAVFVRIGLSGADLGTSWLLPRLVDTGLAAELLYTGRAVHAEEAARIGLVNRVVSDSSLDALELESRAQVSLMREPATTHAVNRLRRRTKV